MEITVKTIRNRYFFAFLLFLLLFFIDLFFYDYGSGPHEVSKSFSLKLIIISFVGFFHKMNGGNPVSFNANGMGEVDSGFLLDFTLTYVSVWLGLIPLVYGFGYSKVISIVLMVSIVWSVSAISYVFPFDYSFNKVYFSLFYVLMYGSIVSLIVVHFINGDGYFPYKIVWPF